MRYLVPHVDDLLGRKLAEVTCLTIENVGGGSRGRFSERSRDLPSTLPSGGDATIC